MANNWHITMYPDQFSKRRWWNSTWKSLPIWDVSRFKKPKNNFRTGCFTLRNKIESKSAKKLFISQEKEKKREIFLPSWYNKWTCLHYDEAEDNVYFIICKTRHFNTLNDIRVENSSIKTGYSKGFQQH